MMIHKLAQLADKIRNHKKRHLFLLCAELVGLLIIVQLLYPTDKLLPFSVVDDLSLSGWSKADATQALDDNYQRLASIAIHFEHSEQPYLTPKPAEFGESIDNSARISGIDYPWYLRLVPTSLLWANLVVNNGAPTHSLDKDKMNSYVDKTFGPDCKITSQNASIVVENDNLVVKDAIVGGTCKLQEVKDYLNNLDIETADGIFLPVKAELPEIMTGDAGMLVDQIYQKIANGIDVVALNETVKLPESNIVNWLDFSVVDGKLQYSFNEQRASGFLSDLLAQKVKIDATVTRVTTNDFIELDRISGTDGQQLDIAKTLNNIKQYIDGGAETVSVGVLQVASPIEYTRSYTTTNAGMAALMQNFASSHAGTYGSVLVEISGKQRTAAYNGDKKFTTASTYKLFVAYSTLLRIESGAWKWDDPNIYGGKNLAKCFDDMIVLSNNECARALMKRASNSAVTSEARAIGCLDTSFSTNNYISTANNLALFLVKLETGQILSQQSSRDTLISAMKRNVYRQGIPSGTNSVVADKVGFLDALLHDASIVYAPTGTYILVIMTDDSSWANIASLTQQLDALISI